MLLAIGMPGSGGIEAARATHAASPTTKVVMLTASDEEDDVYDALRAGASGYVLEDGLPDDLPGLVRAVARDLGLLLSPSIAAKMLAEFKGASARRDAAPGLSDRKIEVLRLVGLGRTNDQIGEELFVSATRSSAAWPTSWPSSTSAPAPTPSCTPSGPAS